jgi:hypothetical protein
METFYMAIILPITFLCSVRLNYMTVTKEKQLPSPLSTYFNDNQEMERKEAVGTQEYCHLA